MVVSSRQLRRPSLRSHTLRSSKSSSPPVDDTPPSLPQSDDAENQPRTKRIRASTVSEQKQEIKRRRLSNKLEIAQLRIPLRSRGASLKIDAAPGVAPPLSLPGHAYSTSNTNTPIESPSGKPQYDQIQIIEKKARAAIRKGAADPTTTDDRRKLRSEDGGSRAKTELAQYFPEFEDMLSLNPPDPEALTVHTKIVLVDDTPDFAATAPRSDPFGAKMPLHNTQILQLRRNSSCEAGAPDPLGDAVYIKAHQKAERHEKQMKNGDRERAQHEKYQLEKLLDDLRGPDWLKTLGITGVTDSEKKRYEPKRLLFIRETQALINKFKRWKEEEKRRKLEREQALLVETLERRKEGQNDEGDDGNTPEGRRGQDDDGDGIEEDNDDDEGTSELADIEDSGDGSSSPAPGSSEIDDLAAQQLIDEAKSANKRRKPTALPLLPEPPSHQPYTSFFAKRHLRDAAVAGRQRGRTILAFGQPLPDLEQREFELPEDILTEDAIKASQRSRRRQRRNVEDD